MLRLIIPLDHSVNDLTFQQLLSARQLRFVRNKIIGIFSDGQILTRACCYCTALN
jgi:hypothetical protein